MPGKIKAEDLLPATKKKLGLEPKTIKPRLISLGHVLQALHDLTTRDALWVLRTATNHVRQCRKHPERP